jgi:hypothetical protein
MVLRIDPIIDRMMIGCNPLMRTPDTNYHPIRSRRSLYLRYKPNRISAGQQGLIRLRRIGSTMVRRIDDPMRGGVMIDRTVIFFDDNQRRRIEIGWGLIRSSDPIKVKTSDPIENW